MTLVLTVLSSYGQTDSTNSTVTIPLATANRIEQQLQDCRLAKLQLVELLAADSAQQAKLSHLSATNLLLTTNFKEVQIYSEKLQRKVDKLNKHKKLKNWVIGGSLILGFVLGSQ